jgi:hypothetical protein
MIGKLCAYATVAALLTALCSANAAFAQKIGGAVSHVTVKSILSQA